MPLRVIAIREVSNPLADEPFVALRSPFILGQTLGNGMSECDPYSQQKNEKYHSHTRQWADISSKIALRLAYQHTLSVVATPMSQPLFHLAFPVGDIPQTKAFYVAGLGFDILPCLKAEDSCSWFHERTYFIRFPF